MSTVIAHREPAKYHYTFLDPLAHLHRVQERSYWIVGIGKMIQSSDTFLLSGGNQLVWRVDTVSYESNILLFDTIIVSSNKRNHGRWASNINGGC